MTKKLLVLNLSLILHSVWEGLGFVQEERTRLSDDAIGKKIYFPISQAISWSPLDPAQISCEFESRTPELTDSTQIVGKLPILKSEYKIEGYLCTKIILSTKCEKGFFGGESLSRIEGHIPISRLECLNAVLDFHKGNIQDLNYPVKECSWMKTSVKSINIIHVVPRTMLYNPYESNVKSEIFPEGSCNDSICETIYPSKLWVPDHIHRPQCISDHLDTSVFYIKTYGKDKGDFWSPDINIKTSDHICIMDYCGIGGIRFADGSWIGVNVNDIPKTSPELGAYLMDLEDCPKNFTLNDYEKFHTEHLAEKTLIEKFYQKECLKTKAKIEASEHISRIELQSLTPISPGFHRVYRLNNGFLEMGLSEYREGFLTKPVKEHPIVFKTTRGIEKEWKYWTHDVRQNIFDGPNGLFVHDGRIISAISDLNEYGKAISLSSKLRTEIKTLSKTKHLVNETESSFIFELNGDESLSTVATGWWDSIGHYIREAIIFVAIPSIVWIVIIWIFLKVSFKSSSSPLPYYNPDRTRTSGF